MEKEVGYIIIESESSSPKHKTSGKNYWIRRETQPKRVACREQT